MTEEFKKEKERCMKAIAFMKENHNKMFELMKDELAEILDLKPSSDIVTLARGILFWNASHEKQYRGEANPPENKNLNVYIQILVDARKEKK